MYVDRFEFVGGPLDGNELLPDEPQNFNAGEYVGVPLPSGIQVYRKRDDESDYWDFYGPLSQFAAVPFYEPQNN